MKKVFITISFISIAFLGISQSIKKVKINDLLQEINASAEPTIINFWASWCKPCLEEIPWMEQNVDSIKNTPIKLILVSLDIKADYPDNITAFVQKNKYHSEVVWLDESNANMYCPKIDRDWFGNLPVTLFINRKKGYRKFYNQQISAPQFKIALQKLLNN